MAERLPEANGHLQNGSRESVTPTRGVFYINGTREERALPLSQAAFAEIGRAQNHPNLRSRDWAKL